MAGELVDVHHHAFHPQLVDRMRRAGVTRMAPGVPLPRWSVEDSLAVMDANGIGTAVLSVLLPNDALALPAGEAADLVRRTNEMTAELRRDHPGRFGMFASLPMPDVDAVVKEIGYAYDTLGADGVVLAASQPDGRYLGDPGFGPVFAELDRRGAVVFIHPNPSAACRCTGGPGFTAAVPPPLVDFIMDTTRAVANLMFSGTLRRHPAIRYVLAHGGGAVPYLSWRLDLAATWVMAGDDRVAGLDVPASLRRLYYELAQSASPAALAALREITDDDHILFGTDYPFMTGPVIGLTRDRTVECARRFGLSTVAVNRDNALRLLPGLLAGTAP